MIVSRILIRDVKLPEVAAFVGIDWADQKHDVVLRSVGDPTKVEHGYWGAMGAENRYKEPSTNGGRAPDFIWDTEDMKPLH